MVLAGCAQRMAILDQSKPWTDASVCEGNPGRQGGYILNTMPQGRMRIDVDVSAVSDLIRFARSLLSRRPRFKQSMPEDRVSSARDS